MYACTVMCICVSAAGPDSGIRPFDESPNGLGQLAGAEQSRDHQRVGAQALGLVLLLPFSACLPLTSSDQYWFLITKDSMVDPAFSHLLSQFFFFFSTSLYHTITTYTALASSMCVYVFFCTYTCPYVPLWATDCLLFFFSRIYERELLKNLSKHMNKLIQGR